MEERCILINRSNGDPIGLNLFTHNGNATVDTLLDNITAHPQVGTCTVTPPPALYSLPPDKAPEDWRARATIRLRSLRPDWRPVIEECDLCSRTTRLSDIREGYTDAANLVYLIALCVISSLRPITEEVLDRRGRRNPITRPLPSVAASIRDKIKPPSTSANNACLMETERPNHSEAVYDGRPSDLTGPSIAIYHPIFAEFQRLLGQTPAAGEIPIQALKAASTLISLSTGYYAKESDRQAAIAPAVISLLETVIFRETTLQYGSQSFKPDGHRTAKCGLFDSLEPGYQGMLELIAEVKNGIGQGDRDPIEQCGKSFLVVATSSELAKLRSISCMPSFLLGITGPYITVSGAIYIDGVVSERLTDMISLVPVLSSQAPIGHPSPHDKLVFQIAHLFSSLQQCLDQLACEYLSMSPREGPVDDRLLLPKPHFSSFSSGDTQYNLTYRHRLFESRSDRAVFSAEAKSALATKECIVKFTSRYFPKAHELAYKQGAAPELLYCQFVPSVGKFCVVTEYIDEPDGARLSADGIEKLEHAVKTLHGQSYVLGDLRDANILVDGDGHPYLIDFDWSGVEGSVFYPMDLNTQGIDWAEGVHGGAKITRGHDEAMLKRFLDAQK
ncbi:hypothetical protein HGRIS_001609 [Hohenbuehelia grisea]|uniref:Protein kinase domain-containing protein n=1 Tax=Hohenbuehelia grisea TaxID=104357 RepID=A0ABR3JJN2_9AGAR